MRADHATFMHGAQVATQKRVRACGISAPLAFVVERQLERESRTGTRRAVGRNPATVELDDALDDREAKSGACSVFARGV